MSTIDIHGHDISAVEYILNIPWNLCFILPRKNCVDGHVYLYLKSICKISKYPWVHYVLYSRFFLWGVLNCANYVRGCELAEINSNWELTATFVFCKFSFNHLQIFLHHVQAGCNHYSSSASQMAWIYLAWCEPISSGSINGLPIFYLCLSHEIFSYW